MSRYRIHTLDSAPEPAKPLLRALAESFGFLPNIAGAMAASPTLLGAFVGVFEKVHAGSFSEAQIQTVLLTNAVTNASEWPTAFHSALALQAGIAPTDVAALRERRAPSDPKLAALSRLARAMIDQRGHLGEPELAAFHDAGFGPELVLELLTITAASTMTNYVANITKPELEAAFRPYAWSK
jgi:alkylhydroperoxidase family enzyme